MSVNLSTKLISRYDWKSAVPTLRYAFGSAFILAFALGSGHLLSFIIPVMAIGFIAPDAKPISLKSAFQFTLILTIVSLVGILFSRMFLGYAMVFIPLLALAILHLFYNNTLNTQFKTWLLISLLLIPFMSTFSRKLGDIVAFSLILNGGLAAIFCWYIFMLLPYFKPNQQKEVKEAIITESKSERFAIAFRSLVVILPVVVAFYIYQWTGAILIMIFVVILSMNPATANFKIGKFMILANLIGGILAILAFNLFVIVPDLTFLILITIIVGIYAGSKISLGGPMASLYSTAFSTYILVLGSVTTSTEGDASAKVWSRILQIGIAVSYVVIAFALYNHFSKSTKGSAHDN